MKPAPLQETGVPQLLLGRQHRNAALLDMDHMLQQAICTKTLASVCPALAPDGCSGAPPAAPHCRGAKRGQGGAAATRAAVAAHVDP